MKILKTDTSLFMRLQNLQKKLVDENQAKKAHDDFVFEENYDTGYTRENPVEHAIMVKASEADDKPSGRLISFLEVCK